MHPRHKPTRQHHRLASPHYSGQKRRFRIQISNSFKKIYSDTKKIVAKTSTNFGHQYAHNIKKKHILKLDAHKRYSWQQRLKSFNGGKAPQDALRNYRLFD
jgi:hypothetical protein